MKNVTICPCFGIILGVMVIQRLCHYQLLIVIHESHEPRIAFAEQVYDDVCINEYAFHLNFAVRYS